MTNHDAVFVTDFMFPIIRIGSSEGNFCFLGAFNGFVEDDFRCAIKSRNPGWYKDFNGKF